MNEKDLRILACLDENARQSNTQIAKKLKLSTDSIDYRIKKMEKEGVIKGYGAIIDLPKLGYKLMRYYVSLQKLDPLKEKRIIEFLKKQTGVWWVGKTVGSIDLLIAHWGKADSEFIDFRNEFLSNFKPFIRKEQIAQVDEYSYLEHKYIKNDKKLNFHKIKISDQQIKLDSKDIALLRALALNGRESLVSLSKKLVLTPEAVKHRMKKLKSKGVILTYRVLIDQNKLGYWFYKLDLHLVDFSKKKEIISWTKSQPNTLFFISSLGGADIELDLHIKDFGELTSFLEEIKKNFPGVIREYNYFVILKNYKDIYFPY
jgi:Lrp/AsnC family transcriptional regulator, leucine-responsive regulatory protein